jgi:adenylate kinase
MRIILLGPPGSGKSVLADKLSRKYKLPILNMHRILSSMANEDTELGRLVGELLLACAPIPEELVYSALKEPCDEAKKGFILDDFPRELVHAEMLHQLLLSLGASLELVIAINVKNDDIMERLVGQSHCNACGEDYNIYTSPPMVEGVCDMCGGRISRRPADYEEGISNRLRVCEANQNELISRYKEEGILQVIHGLADEPKAYQAACKLVDDAPRIPLTDPEILKLRAESEAKKKRAAKKRTRKKRVVRKKATTKRVVRKKSAAKKKVVAKKSVAKKVTAKKKVTTKKKAVAKKVAAKKKSVAKKTLTKKRVTTKKKVAAKKAVTKKVVTKKAVVKKKPAAKKKVASKKKVVTKKVVAKKRDAAKKSAVKKKTAVKKKSVAKKKVSKKKSARKKRVTSQ